MIFIINLNCNFERILLVLDGFELIEFSNDMETNICIAGGVECSELATQTVYRRSQFTGKLYLEKIYFVKHIDNKFG